MLYLLVFHTSLLETACVFISYILQPYPVATEVTFF